uniref:GNAT family N-acetyltransferase n=1 Tax=Ningiella ruwaisensis TaxID=2364274 RepID=UPI0010A0AF25|nr:GNAT family N-acetyltransferase [Ningiella ruwaisensis]
MTQNQLEEQNTFTSWSWRFCDDLSSLSDIEWQSSTGNDSPFLSLPFLQLLANSKSVDGDTGWQSNHILIFEQGISENKIENEKILALVPCYLKTHSYGEYVFDHAWANAYHQYQLPYYPKLVVAIPFTPVTGSRALLSTKAYEINLDEEMIFSYLARQKDEIIKRASASSLHVLFTPKSISDALRDNHLHQRLSVQFVWQNRAYANFDEFLAALTSRKRKSIRKERAPFVNTSNIEIRTLFEDNLDKKTVEDFYRCYQQTYFKRSGHAGYLTRTFFEKLIDVMRKQICIVGAFKDERMIAASLFFYNSHTLYGRYWGSLEEVSGLHFECCYYRGIEFAISKQLQTFNPGTQGEHKILRGFAPSFCYSNHFLAHESFDNAVADFVKREKPAIEQYFEQASAILPYKQS